MADNMKDNASESLEGDLDLSKSDTDDVVGGVARGTDFKKGPRTEKGPHTEKGPRP
jgi:hypothetical protein